MEHIDQLIHGCLEPLGWSGEAFVRLGLAAILGALVGLERETRGRQAGFRTNLLVCMGSALVMLVSQSLALYPWHPAGQYAINVDPGRIAYGVMTGIGFLGAGAIIKQQETVRGLTTAASMWGVAAVGLAVGHGLYALAIASAILILAALRVLRGVERYLPRRVYRRVVIRCPWGPSAVPDLVERVERHGLDVLDYGFRRVAEMSKADVEVFVVYTRPAAFRALEQALYDDPQCELVCSENSR